MAKIKSDADIAEGLTALCLLDPCLVRVVDAAGPVPLRLAEPGFAGLAHIIVSQMVSKASASAIWRRMSAQGTVDAANYLAHTPDVVAGFGLSRAKARTLETLARAVVEGHLDLDGLADLEDEDIQARLVALPGIGPWTAEVYRMLCLGSRDIFPAGDVALRAAVGHAFQWSQRPTADEVAERALFWRPWRAVAARLFWAYYASVLRRDALPLG
ncbi:DNA-3-methyladenine glycosylase II [Neorhizobium galegae]|uniref:DNA-3-methyladenine glycosylase family protein n=1 Tax=Neorhizobium galegae TaxID=399 RepID=UPI001AE42B32|nr:DNA-3-methyladenine glycosylase 2 family protein [Neorhizobium galegae]MBP2550203.1 DNA-3-methyladenine glycosylase II [Neorhizobium galegae]